MVKSVFLWPKMQDLSLFRCLLCAFLAIFGACSENHIPKVRLPEKFISAKNVYLGQSISELENERKLSSGYPDSVYTEPIKGAYFDKVMYEVDSNGKLVDISLVSPEYGSSRDAFDSVMKICTDFYGNSFEINNYSFKGGQGFIRRWNLIDNVIVRVSFTEESSSDKVSRSITYYRLIFSLTFDQNSNRQDSIKQLSYINRLP